MATKSRNIEELYRAFALLEDKDEVKKFMIDLCTPKELESFAERWQIARLLDKGELSYREIAKETGASTTTIGRVFRFLQQESYQGYRLILDKMKNS